MYDQAEIEPAACEVQFWPLNYYTMKTIDVKKRFLRSLFLSRLYVFNVFYFANVFFLFCYYFLSNTCGPVRQSIVTVVRVTACNCKPRKYL